MHPQIAALVLSHPHHHATNAAVKAFHTFGTVTHHGSGEMAFWLVIAVLVLLFLASLGRKRSRA
jgi:hypothetical protein